MHIISHSLEKSKAATDYASRGWLIFPLHSVNAGRCTCGRDDCTSPGKHPRTLNGVKDATNNTRTVEAWWRQWPEANVGLATGRESGFFVLDVDGPEGEETLKALEKTQGALPPTTTVVTGNGKHFYFKYPMNGEIKNSTTLAPGLHLRGEGGYVVAPPSVHVSGRRYEWLVSPNEVGLAEAPSWLVEFIARRSQSEGGSGFTAEEWEVDVQEGERNDALTRRAGKLFAAKMPAKEVLETLLSWNERHCRPPLQAAEVRRVVESIARREAAKTRSDASAADGAKVELPPPVKDLGHALVLAELWRDRYRWADHRKSWMAWNGKRWEPITDNQVAAAASADLRAEYARRVPMARGEDEIKRLAAAVVETCFFSKINGALNFLKGMDGFHTNPEEWDADLWALNCDNGIIDLKTGDLRPHTPAALCTKLVPVAYDPNAKGEKWEAHLKRFLPNPNIRRQVQRDLGLSLTGANLEEMLPIWYGTGSNGKSTTAKVILAVLGDYAETAPKDLLILQKHESHPTEIANLAGKRCVFASEIEQGARLNEAKVKLLTGGDRIKARYLFCDFFEFDQTWTITLFCNHKPVITGTDYAIWRRVRLVPWTVKIAEAEKIPQDEIIRELVAEGPAILKWLLDGFADWQRDHHWMADEVKAATEGYRQEQDRLAGFFADCCEFGPHWSVAVADLYSAYVEWCEQVGEEPLGKKAFGDRLRDREIAQKRIGHENIRRWIGIRLLATKCDQTFRKFSMRDDIEKVTETTVANGRTFSDRGQPPKNDIVTIDTIVTAQKPVEEWPACRECNRQVPEVNGDGLCDDCAATCTKTQERG